MLEIVSGPSVDFAILPPRRSRDRVTCSERATLGGALITPTESLSYNPVLYEVVAKNGDMARLVFWLDHRGIAMVGPMHGHHLACNYPARWYIVASTRPWLRQIGPANHQHRYWHYFRRNLSITRFSVQMRNEWKQKDFPPPMTVMATVVLFAFIEKENFLFFFLTQSIFIRWQDDWVFSSII